MDLQADSLDLGRRFCDLVMKGGITSGVVYPSAIAHLADTYVLRSIGGASAGAIAAAGAAAAEYRRQNDPECTRAGFDRLAGLAKELGERPRHPSSGKPLPHSRLFYLFAPSRLSGPVFSVLVGMLNRPSVKARIGYGVLAMLRAFPGAFLAAVLLWGAALAPLFMAHGAGGGSTKHEGPSSIWDALASLVTPASLASIVNIIAVTVCAVLALLIVAAWRSFRYFARIMAEQAFGMCTGMQEKDAKGPAALTEWLYALLQSIAGKDPKQPLTFGDLRRIGFKETPGRDGIVLRVMTTCLTAGRPYSVPFTEDRFHFDPTELRRFFPEEVVAWMEQHPWGPRGAEDETADDCARAFERNGKARPLVALPHPDHLPVIVGVRMSLSFPVLLSAIPLWHYSSGPENGKSQPMMERLWFTDGGVCSNLPIHLFDSPLPRWPTFAIDLRNDLPEGASDVQRVRPPLRGRNYWGERNEVESAGLFSFFTAILNTMQNWHDALQRSAPGYKERVFTVRHTKKEGGLNIDMPVEAIGNMARSGAATAKAIVDCFHPKQGTPPVDDDWQYHRWVRIRLLLPVLEKFLAKLDSATQSRQNQPSVQDMLTASPAPMGPSFELNKATGQAGWKLLVDAGAAAQQLSARQADFESTSPRPVGVLRVTPEP